MEDDCDSQQAAGDESSKDESESNSSDASGSSSNGGALHMKAVVDDDCATVMTTPVDGDGSSMDECNNNLLTGGLNSQACKVLKLS